MLPPPLWDRKNYTVVLKFFNKVTEHLLRLAYVDNLRNGHRPEIHLEAGPLSHLNKVNNIFIIHL